MSKRRIVWAIVTMGFIGLIISIYFSFEMDYHIYKGGKLVPVVITNIPTGFASSKTSRLMKFNYGGAIYSITIHGNTGHFNLGDTIQLRYLKGYEDDFLLPNDNPLKSTVPLELILLIGAFGSAYYFYKDKDPTIPSW